MIEELKGEPKLTSWQTIYRMMAAPYQDWMAKVDAEMLAKLKAEYERREAARNEDERESETG